MYAVIETGGKQLRVEVGQSIYVEKLDVQPGEEVVFNTVVLYANRTTKIGTPYVKGAKVTCKVEKQGKEKKVTIFKYKAKDGSSHRKQGHRQPYTKVEITQVGSEVAKAKPAAKKKADETAEAAVKKTAAAEKKPAAKKTAEKPAAEKKPAAKKEVKETAEKTAE